MPELTRLGRIKLPDPDCTQWGAWEFNPDTLTMVHSSYRFYEIHCDEIHTSAEMLDKIFQVSAKRWVTAKDQADLIEAFREIFNPQFVLCPGGSDHTISNHYLRDKYDMKRRMKASPHTPKFREGQRVRISALAVEDRIKPAGITGTVVACNYMVTVQIDGAQKAYQYRPDYWDAIAETATEA
jgi:hypothetical protein